MRWLLDQGLPRSAAEILREAGEDAVHAGEIGMAQASDLEILRRASEESRVVVTLDADFHAILASMNMAGPSVVRIREEGLKGMDVYLLVKRIAGQFSEMIASGCVLTFSSGKVRLRHLPIR